MKLYPVIFHFHTILLLVAKGACKFPPQHRDLKVNLIIIHCQKYPPGSLKLLTVQVNFLTKLVALKPGKVVLNMIRNVMQGKDEGADNSGNNDEDETSQRVSIGVAGRVSLIEGRVLVNM